MLGKVKKGLAYAFIGASAPFTLIILPGCIIPNSHMPMFWLWWIALNQAGDVIRKEDEDDRDDHI